MTFLPDRPKKYRKIYISVSVVAGRCVRFTERKEESQVTFFYYVTLIWDNKIFCINIVTCFAFTDLICIFYREPELKQRTSSPVTTEYKGKPDFIVLFIPQLHTLEFTL